MATKPGKTTAAATKNPAPVADPKKAAAKDKKAPTKVEEKKTASKTAPAQPAPSKTAEPTFA